MSEVWKRRGLYFAGVWNLIAGAGALFDPASHLEQFYTTPVTLEDPVHLFFFRCVWLMVIAFGLGYVLAARNPVAMQPLLTCGAVGKALYFGACFLLFQSGSGTPLLLAGGVLDLAFASFFVYLVWRLPTRSAWPATPPRAS